MPLHGMWEYRDIGRLFITVGGGECDNRGAEVGLGGGDSPGQSGGHSPASPATHDIKAKAKAFSLSSAAGRLGASRVAVRLSNSIESCYVCILTIFRFLKFQEFGLWYKKVNGDEEQEGDLPCATLSRL